MDHIKKNDKNKELNDSYPRGHRKVKQPRARPFSISKGSRSQPLQKTNPLIVRPLSRSPNCVLYREEPVSLH